MTAISESEGSAGIGEAIRQLRDADIVASDLHSSL
jgi:hypothetical protein